MTDPSSSDQPVPTVRALRERTVRQLRALRFVGPATAATLAKASVTATDIRGRSVSYLDLIELGVDPGVAARIRREYSLAWSNETTSGARLRRRAGHIRNLRDDERSWIDESWRKSSSNPADSAPATPDGSGSLTDAELAWRERSRTDSDLRSTNRADANSAMSGTNPTRSAPADTTTRIDPGDHTVPELEEALEYLEHPDVLARVLQAERAGNDRVTAIDAIERRIRSVGKDPDNISRRVGEKTSSAPEKTSHRWSDEGPFTVPGSDAAPALSTVVARFHERLANSLDHIRCRVADLELSDRFDDIRSQGAKFELSDQLDRVRGRAADIDPPDNLDQIRGRVVDLELSNHFDEVRGRVADVDLIDRHLEAPRRVKREVRAVEAEEWRLLTVALLVGLTSFSILAVLVTVLRPDVGLPIGALPLFLITAVGGSISVPLRWWETKGGYVAALLTGLLGLLSVGVIAAGAFGTTGISSITLALYVVVASAVVATTDLWRRAEPS